MALTRWMKNGDHPDDGVGDFIRDHYTGRYYPRLEGAVVRFFRRPEPEFAGHVMDGFCGFLWRDHGWMDDKSNDGEGTTVCPGDMV